MKPTQMAELFANIKKTFVSFFSILMFVALGVGIFLGISWSGKALQNAAETEFDKGAFHDFQVVFPYGLTEDDIAKLSEVEGVTDVEGVRQSIQTFVADSKSYTAKVQAVGERINTLDVVEGVLPSHQNEIALNAHDAETFEISVGDAITFEKDTADSSDGDADADGMKYLKGGTYKVTALVHSPEYIANEVETHGMSGKGSGTIHLLAWVIPEAFDGSAFGDAYPVGNVRCEGLDSLSTFSDEYKDASAQIEARIADLGTTRAKQRCDTLRDDAQKNINNGQAKLDDGRKQVSDGEKQIEQAKKDIKNGEKKIKDGEAELENAKKKVSDGEAQLAVARDELSSKSAEGKKKLDELHAKVQKGQAEYDKAAKEVQTLRGIADVVQDFIDASQASIDSLQADYDRAVANLAKHGNPEEVSASALDATASGSSSKTSGKSASKASQKNIAALKEEVDAAYAALEAARAVRLPLDGKNLSLEEVTQYAAEMSGEVSEAEQVLASKKALLDAGWSKYNDAKATYDNEVSKAQAKISKGESELANGKERITQGERELKEARAKVKEGKKEVKEKTKELEDAKKEVAEAAEKLEDAKRNLAKMKDSAWGVLPRLSNAGAAQDSMFSKVVNLLSLSMAALFIIVGLLVSYSAVGRIVHEQIVQIGTKKALGLRSREITLSFLGYSALAVVSGAIVGAIMAVIVVEGIIGNSVGSMFTFGDYAPYFGWPLFLGVTALEIALVLGATWLACHSILGEHAIELLKGEKPPEGKTRFYEKWAMWDKLPLFTQTIVNNCMNDKRRVFSTIVGVAGCTALIVTALTLNDDVLASFERHYQNVYGYNAIAYVDGDVDGALDSVQKTMADQGLEAVQVRRQNLAINQPDGDRGSIRMIVCADDAAFARAYHVNLTSGGTLDLQGEGVWVSQAYAQHQGAKVGDEVSVDVGDGVKHKLPILGFYEFWLTYQEMVIGSSCYEKEFGETYEPNALLIDMGDTDVASLEGSLANVKGFSEVVDDKAHQKQYFDLFASVSRTVVLIYLVLAIIMAIVVLLNLNVMFIDEKKRDLIVLMINGFSTHDAKRYIYNDTIALTIIGIVVGIVLGCVMGAVTVLSVEPASAVFLLDIDPLAVAVGVLGSIVLAFAMSFIALRRIPKFNLTDINKV